MNDIITGNRLRVLAFGVNTGTGTTVLYPSPTQQGNTYVLRTDLIQCPECGQMIEADVTWTEGDPFPTFLEICPTCEYVIMESEWDVVGTEKPNATATIR